MMQPFLSCATLHETGEIPIRFETDVVRARNLGTLLAKEIGFDRTTCIRIGTTVSELTRNILEYTQGGNVNFFIAQGEDNVSGLVTSFEDQGPGIEDLDLITSDHFQSVTGMGIGIAGSQKLMDDFDIQSNPENGTLEAQQEMLSSGAITHVQLSQQEMSLQHHYKVCNQMLAAA